MKLVKAERKQRVEAYKRYSNQLVYGIDGYYERTLIDADSYFLFDRHNKGIISIHIERGLTGFYIFDEYLDEYEELLDFVLSLERIKKIMFSDTDIKLYNSLRLRGYNIEMQAYNFVLKNNYKSDYDMELANLHDINLLEKVFGNFIKDYETKIKNNEIFINYDKDKYPISLGAFDMMILKEKRACIAMKVSEKYLRQGYGVKTVVFIINILKGLGIESNARCWYMNEISKKTLLKSGFEVSNHLLRVENVKNVTYRAKNGRKRK